VCGELFRADARVGRRQRACGGPECQQQRRRQTQARWRQSHPDYFVDRRLRRRAVEVRAATAAAGRGAKAARLPEPLSVPAELRRIPWDLAQDEIGVQTTDFITVVACVLVRLQKDQRRGQVTDPTGLGRR
jgi:hypothetical protein